MTINLKQLSARLGLSPTTVSRALGGYSDVSPTTRDRVQRLAEALDYHPSRAARQIALGRADAVGVVYPLGDEFLGNPAFLETLAGLADALQAVNHDLLLAAAPRTDELLVYERMVRGRRVDALVVAHTLREDPRIDYLLKAGVPFVAYGRSARPGAYPWLDFDNEAGARLAVQRLAALGHRRIAYAHASLQYQFAFQRHAGYLAGMAQAGLRVNSAWVTQAGIDRRAGHAAGQRLLALQPRPTAVIVDNCIGGIGLIRALLDAGAEIGREISVLVYEGIPPDTLFAGLQVAAIEQPTPYRSGQKIGAMVLALIEGRQLPKRQVLCRPEFVDGNSIGPARRRAAPAQGDDAGRARG
ncbi:MAG: substrate-binding domain-containing protein [Burkholderiales bacterium]|nr:substrate-binding domain-containing protein [Burkholderiales bacterium]